MKQKIKSNRPGPTPPVQTDKLLGSLEQKIMNIVWDSPHPIKPADVLARLEGKYAYTTIMTELKRMADKKLLTRRLQGRVYLYSPLKTKEAFAKNCLCGLFGNIVGSYGDLAISQFVDAVKQNKDDLKILKEYLDKTA